MAASHFKLPHHHNRMNSPSQAITDPSMAPDLELVSPNSVPPPKLIAFLSCLLERLAYSNDHDRRLAPHKVSAFRGLTRPAISIQKYLDRIFEYANCSPSCFIVAYVYLDRFAQRHPLIPIDSFNVHRLLITSVMVAAKFMDDVYYNNAYYAKVGGVSTAEMNFLEVDFLFGLGFDLNVTPNTYHTYCSYLHREMLMQVQSPLPNDFAGFTERNAKLHLCFKEDESSHQQQQLAV